MGTIKDNTILKVSRVTEETIAQISKDQEDKRNSLKTRSSKQLRTQFKISTPHPCSIKVTKEEMQQITKRITSEELP